MVSLPVPCLLLSGRARMLNRRTQAPSRLSHPPARQPWQGCWGFEPCAGGRARGGRSMGAQRQEELCTGAAHMPWSQEAPEPLVSPPPQAAGAAQGAGLSKGLRELVVGNVLLRTSQTPEWGSLPRPACPAPCRTWASEALRGTWEGGQESPAGPQRPGDALPLAFHTLKTRTDQSLIHSPTTNLQIPGLPATKDLPSLLGQQEAPGPGPLCTASLRKDPLLSTPRARQWAPGLGTAGRGEGNGQGSGGTSLGVRTTGEEQAGGLARVTYVPGD